MPFCWRWRSVPFYKNVLRNGVMAVACKGAHKTSGYLFKMAYDEYTMVQILRWHQMGIRPPTIQKLLARERIIVSRKGVAKFIKRFQRTGKLIHLNF